MECNGYCWTAAYNDKVVKGCTEGSTSTSEKEQINVIKQVLPDYLTTALTEAIKTSPTSCSKMATETKSGQKEFKAVFCYCITDECNTDALHQTDVKPECPKSTPALKPPCNAGTSTTFSIILPSLMSSIMFVMVTLSVKNLFL